MDVLYFLFPSFLFLSSIYFNVKHTFISFVIGCFIFFTCNGKVGTFKIKIKEMYEIEGTVGTIFMIIHITSIFTAFLLKTFNLNKEKRALVQKSIEIEDYQNDAHIIFNSLLLKMNKKDIQEQPGNKLFEIFVLIQNEEQSLFKYSGLIHQSYLEVLKIYFSSKDISKMVDRGEYDAALSLIETQIMNCLKYTEYSFLLYDLVFEKIRIMLTKKDFDLAEAALTYAMQLDQEIYKKLSLWVDITRRSNEKTKTIKFFDFLFKNKLFDYAEHYLQNAKEDFFSEDLNFMELLRACMENSCYGLAETIIQKTVHLRKGNELKHIICEHVLNRSSQRQKDEIGKIFVLCSYWGLYNDFMIQEIIKKRSLEVKCEVTRFLIEGFIENKSPWYAVYKNIKKEISAENCVKCARLFETSNIFCPNCYYYNKDKTKEFGGPKFFDALVGFLSI